MNVAELTEALHAPRRSGSGPDLDEIRRQGRRITVRRRARTGVVAAVAAAALAAPWTLLADHGAPQASPLGGVRYFQDDSPEGQFLANAPFAAPMGTVIDVPSKFYVRAHGFSVGSLALWAEGAGPRLAYGSRAIDTDDKVRRAGYLDAPVLPLRGGSLVRVPRPGGSFEPTFVGLVATGAGADAVTTATVQVRSVDTLVQSGVSATADPGYLLVWVTATDGRDPGIDLRSFTVRGPGGQVLARGSFS